jgi:hypothetical protein
MIAALSKVIALGKPDQERMILVCRSWKLLGVLIKF